MSTREYTLPDGSKKRHIDGGRVADRGSFPRRWLDHQDPKTLAKWGITVEEIPDPVRTPPTLEQVKARAKGDARQIALDALVKTTVARASSDIDAAKDEVGVQVVLNSLM